MAKQFTKNQLEISKFFLPDMSRCISDMSEMFEQTLGKIDFKAKLDQNNSDCNETWHRCSRH